VGLRQQQRLPHGRGLCPVADDDVQVLVSEPGPDRPHETLGLVYAKGDGFSSQARLIAHMRSEAAKLGANAIVLADGGQAQIDAKGDQYNMTARALRLSSEGSSR
jgi:hypothetical protein